MIIGYLSVSYYNGFVKKSDWGFIFRDAFLCMMPQGP